MISSLKVSRPSFSRFELNDDYYSLKCYNCGKPAHMRGNLIEFENKKICTICMDEIKMKEITKQEQK